MKLATLKNASRDGALVLVSRDLRQYLPVPAIAATLQAALDDWDAIAPQLELAYAGLNAGQARRAAIRRSPVPFAAAARLPVGRWLGLYQPCRTGAQGA